MINERTISSILLRYPNLRAVGDRAGDGMLENGSGVLGIGGPSVHTLDQML